MTDRELLELAAKAAGLKYETFCDGKPIIRAPYGQPVYWNPLTDDGDALRLAVKLGLDITFGIHRCQVNVTDYDWAEDCVSVEIAENGRDDPYAATRRAIVRAAAEIGKKLK